MTVKPAFPSEAMTIEAVLPLVGVSGKSKVSLGAASPDCWISVLAKFGSPLSGTFCPSRVSHNPVGA